MSMMTRRDLVLGTVTGLALGVRLAAQKGPHAVDLATLAENNQLKHANRTVGAIADGARKGVRLSEGPGEGPAYVPGLTFGDGIIECDIRGKNAPQHSFVGIAFHGVDAATYDAVYFRPFNFRTPDPVSHAHAVQYV